MVSLLDIELLNQVTINFNFCVYIHIINISAYDSLVSIQVPFLLAKMYAPYHSHFIPQPGEFKASL